MYEITTDTARFDLDVIHGFLAQSYWSAGVPRSVVERAVKNSLGFAVLADGQQVGFARVVTDRATFAYLADVFVLEAHRGAGVGKKLMRAIFEHQDLQGLRRFLLATRDAHTLYAQFGFAALAAPERFMEINDPDIYTRHP
jgi:GNAT superfamily N-acetyltransferase